MNLRQALILGQKNLRTHVCAGSDPAREAELFLSRAAGLTREAILASPEFGLNGKQERLFRTMLDRRRKHEPVAYIVGTAMCRGLEFEVDRHTLVPRPATESIIDAALAACSLHPDAAVIDVGTGSGCVAIALAKEMPKARVLAVDTSAAALKIARRNASLNRVAARLAFKKGDLLLPLRKLAFGRKKAIIIAANLPYLPTAAIAGLEPDIRSFEPVTALDGGRDGLDLCRRLIDQAALFWPGRDIHVAMELLPEQYGPIGDHARKKIPGIRTEKIMNLAGVCVGAAMRSACTITTAA